MPMFKASEMRIVSGDAPATVVEEVNRLLTKDWTLHGDLKVVHCSTGMNYVQALVKLAAFEPPGASGITQMGGPLIMR